MTDKTEIKLSEYKIGNTIYRVTTIFNPAFQESLSDILNRLILRDCESFLGDNEQEQNRKTV